MLDGTAGRRRAWPGRATCCATRDRRTPDLVLIGTGSEVSVCVDAAAVARGRRARASASCRCRRGSSSTQQTDDVPGRRCCPPACRRSRSRPPSSFGWDRYADDSVGIDHFGAIAPGEVVLEKFGYHRRPTSLDAARTSCSADARRRQELDHVTKRCTTCYEQQDQSPWLDNLKRGWITSGELARVGRARRPRHHLEPDDLPEGDRGRAPTTTSSSRDLVGGGDVGRRRPTGTSSRSDIERRAAPSCARRTTTATASTASSRSRWPRSWPATPTARSTPARHLHATIDEPNLYVKIPGTAEGRARHPADDHRRPQHQRHPAVRARALRRGHRGLPLRARGARRRPAATVSSVASVASFFVSRVDTEVDRRLDAIGTARGRSPCGARPRSPTPSSPTSCSASGSPARRWEALAAKGARVQRPLWASTSTKNPAYPDTLYVDTLIGPHTVNTMPDATLDGVRRPRHRGPHGRRRLDRRPRGHRRAGRGRRRPRRRHRDARGRGRGRRSPSRSTSCSGSAARPRPRRFGQRATSISDSGGTSGDERVAHRRRRRRRRVRRARHRGVPRAPERRRSRSRCPAARPPGTATSAWPTTPARRSTGGRSTSTGATSAACPLDDPDSNYRLAREALLDRVGAANATYPMRCEEGPDPYQLRVGELGSSTSSTSGSGPTATPRRCSRSRPRSTPTPAGSW